MKNNDAGSARGASRDAGWVDGIIVNWSGKARSAGSCSWIWVIAGGIWGAARRLTDAPGGGPQRERLPDAIWNAAYDLQTRNLRRKELSTNARIQLPRESNRGGQVQGRDRSEIVRPDRRLKKSSYTGFDDNSKTWRWNETNIVRPPTLQITQLSDYILVITNLSNWFSKQNKKIIKVTNLRTNLWFSWKNSGRH